MYNLIVRYWVNNCLLLEKNCSAEILVLFKFSTDFDASRRAADSRGTEQLFGRGKGKADLEKAHVNSARAS